MKNSATYGFDNAQIRLEILLTVASKILEKHGGEALADEIKTQFCHMASFHSTAMEIADATIARLEFKGEQK